MGSKSPTNSPIGCLFDSLADIASKIGADARNQPITVWANQRGDLFSLSEAVLAGVPIDTAIGTYDADSPCSAIERDLIHARQHQSARMADWEENFGESAWPTKVAIRRRHHAYS